jgi:hypothetical protein
MDRTGLGSRKLIGLLLALNLGVFLVGMALQQWTPSARAPLVFNAEKITLLAVPGASEAQPASSETKPDPSVAESPAGGRAVSSSRCLSWRSLDAEGLAAIEAHLAKSGIAANVYNIELENKLEKNLGWWVFLPPMPDKAALQLTIEELVRLGVTDYAAVRGGLMRNALSLGAFEKLSQARERAVGLASKGIKGVKFGPRPGAGMVRLFFPDSLADNELPSLEVGWPRGLEPSSCTATKAP